MKEAKKEEKVAEEKPPESKVDMVETNEPPKKTEEDKASPAVPSNAAPEVRQPDPEPQAIPQDDVKPADYSPGLFSALYTNFPYTEQLELLKTFGFDEEQIRVALLHSQGSAELAASYLPMVGQTCTLGRKGHADVQGRAGETAQAGR
eukprot:TRINITY_DN11701_c0_g1_i10.p3 TRINITY_DN11701_c0_g1~~TRINITY_DN11701_c0_g1_i10.p3  ORF type:complete len:148 (+),score=36.96 TRINITY_DN11701_c0_g1_i10:400-843(+)